VRHASKRSLIVRWLGGALTGALLVTVALTVAGLWLVLAWLVGANAATYVAYASDKQLAKRGRRRAPETALLLMSLAGGCAGGLLAMWQFRHKTRHVWFWVVNVAAVVAWAAIALFVAD
jgi:uncharacterized membrane protein YsdA (DUF1294 family)